MESIVSSGWTGSSTRSVIFCSYKYICYISDSYTFFKAFSQLTRTEARQIPHCRAPMCIKSWLQRRWKANRCTGRTPGRTPGELRREFRLKAIRASCATLSARLPGRVARPPQPGHFTPVYPFPPEREPGSFFVWTSCYLTASRVCCYIPARARHKLNAPTPAFGRDVASTPRSPQCYVR